MDDFVHLHVHGDHSLLDGAQSATSVAERVAALGQPAVAITDHGNLFGVMKFYDACLAAGVKPIIGMEAYMAPSDRFKHKKEIWYVDDEGKNHPSGGGSYTHLTLLATGSVGLRNLFEFSSRSWTEGFYSKQRGDTALLEELREGLLIGSGCLGGELAQRILGGQQAEAEEYVLSMKEKFGDAFFIEVMDHGFDRESEVLPQLVAMARRHDIRIVATNDSHYTRSTDSLLHDAMLCLGTYAKISDEKRMRFDGSGYYLKSRAEMAELDLPKEALDNTLWVSDQIGDYDAIFNPVVRMPVLYGERADLVLESKCTEVLIDPDMNFTQEYQERLDYELSVISGKGYSDYFLIYEDLCTFARKNGIRVGPGRGSAAGSLVAYLLGITGYDPLEAGLIFERFLNPDRPSFPDIDVDFQKSRRDEVFAYATEKYGAEFSARISTMGTIAAKAGLKDAARVLGYKYGTGDMLAEGLPEPVAGRSPSLKDTVYRSPGYDDVWDLAGELEGLVRQAGVHASGFVISPVRLIDVLPTCQHSRTSEASSTQFDMREVDRLGLVKFDLLGLKTLDVIEDALRMSDSELPRGFDDPLVYELLRAGETAAVFQLDSPGMRSLLKRVGPREFGHLVAVISLYRPGPMGVDAHKSYADRLNGKEVVSYPHPELRSSLSEILQPTFGVIVFQEQVMQAVQRVCGYTTGEADTIRSIMGKKDRAKLAHEEERFLERGRQNNFSEEALKALWDTLVPFADYAFNKAHAYGYAILAYWCAWLKIYHPKEYMSAMLTWSSALSSPGYVAEVKRMGIPILPPSVNSGKMWTPTEQGVTYGLKSIKGIAEKASEAILSKAPYSSWADYLRRVPVAGLNSGVVKALVSSGSFDEFGGREGMLQALEVHLELAATVRKEAKRGERGFGKAKFDIPTLPVDYSKRGAQEEASLGVRLTYPTAHLHSTRNLSTADWQFVRHVIESNPGSSPVVLSYGRWSTAVEMRGNMEAIVKAVKPLGIEVS